MGRALRVSRGLHELGVGAGDRVALLLRNSLEFLEASIATVPLGASAVPINWHWRGEEIAHVLHDSAAKALILHADLWRGIAARTPLSSPSLSAHGLSSARSSSSGVPTTSALQAHFVELNAASSFRSASLVLTSSVGCSGRRFLCSGHAEMNRRRFVCAVTAAPPASAAPRPTSPPWSRTPTPLSVTFASATASRSKT